MLGVGSDFADFPELQALFAAARDECEAEFVRLIFSQLGRRVETAAKLNGYTSSPTIEVVRKVLNAPPKVASKLARLFGR